MNRWATFDCAFGTGLPNSGEFGYEKEGGAESPQSKWGSAAFFAADDLFLGGAFGGLAFGGGRGLDFVDYGSFGIGPCLERGVS